MDAAEIQAVAGQAALDAVLPTINDLKEQIKQQVQSYQMKHQEDMTAFEVRLSNSLFKVLEVQEKVTEQKEQTVKKLDDINEDVKNLKDKKGQAEDMEAMVNKEIDKVTAELEGKIKAMMDTGSAGGHGGKLEGSFRPLLFWHEPLGFSYL